MQICQNPILPFLLGEKFKFASQSLLQHINTGDACTYALQASPHYETPYMQNAHIFCLTEALKYSKLYILVVHTWHIASMIYTIEHTVLVLYTFLKARHYDFFSAIFLFGSFLVT